MTNKEMILDCLNQDDEAFTQILEYLLLKLKVFWQKWSKKDIFLLIIIGKMNMMNIHIL